MIGTDTDYIAVKWIVNAALLQVSPSASVEHFGRKIEFLAEFKCPLFTQGGRADNNQTALAFCPQLAEYQCSFDSFTQTNFIGENNTFA